MSCAEAFLLSMVVIAWGFVALQMGIVKAIFLLLVGGTAVSLLVSVTLYLEGIC